MKQRLSRILLTCLLIILCQPIKSARAEKEKPRVILSSYEIANDIVEAGEQASIDLTFMNTDKVAGAKSILITIVSVDQKMQPIYGESDQIYINEIRPNQQVKKTVQLNASNDINTESSTLVFNISFVDEAGISYSNTTQISIPVEHPKLLSVLGYSFTDQTTVAAKTSFCARYENTGVDDLYNVEMKLTGESLEEPIRLNLNSLAAGTKSYAETYINFPVAGEQSINVNFSFEDEEGNLYETPTESFHIKVTDNEVSEVSNPQSQVVTSSYMNKQILQGALLVGIIILFIIAVILYRKNKMGDA